MSLGAALLGLASGVVLAATQAPRGYDQVPGEARQGNAALANLAKAQTEAIQALDERIARLEARVKKLESSR